MKRVSRFGRADMIVPALRCDACGLEVTEPGGAVVEMLDHPELVGDLRVARVLHKGTCTGKRDGTGKPRAWQTLGRYLAWLLWNGKFGRRSRRGGKDFVSVEVPEAWV